MKTIPLGKRREAIVDDADFQELKKYNWSLHNTGDREYAMRRKMVAGSVRRIYMHRVILRPIPSEEVDHINGNGLDNRRSNLRSATHRNNIANQSKQPRNRNKYKGVYLDASRKKCWRAQISINSKTKNLGYFYNEEDAARAYNEAAKKQFGEFARLNPV